MIYTLPEAVLGISKDIEAINGKVRIKLEEGIQLRFLDLRGKVFQI
jgi:molecular chaperone DnaJ